MANGGASKMVGTGRERLLEEYEAIGNPFYGTTRPYKSTARLVFDVVNAVPVAAPTVAFLVARQNQVLKWFNYGVGGQIPFTTAGVKVATEADTNLSNGTHTNGVGDFVIEGISCTGNAPRVEYPDAVVPASYSDPDVRGATEGTVTALDPGAIIQPPQLSSPFNLQHVLMQAVIPKLAITFSWDRGTTIPIGTIDQIPEGGARSYLMASGEPSTENRMRIPEGYLWRRQGKKDSDLTVLGSMADQVVVPINIVQLVDAAATPVTVPSHVFLDLVIRLHGIEFQPIGQNR